MVNLTAGSYRIGPSSKWKTRSNFYNKVTMNNIYIDILKNKIFPKTVLVRKFVLVFFFRQQIKVI